MTEVFIYTRMAHLFNKSQHVASVTINIRGAINKRWHTINVFISAECEMSHPSRGNPLCWSLPNKLISLVEDCRYTSYNVVSLFPPTLSMWLICMTPEKSKQEQLGCLFTPLLFKLIECPTEKIKGQIHHWNFAASVNAQIPATAPVISNLEWPDAAEMWRHNAYANWGAESFLRNLLPFRRSNC